MSSAVWKLIKLTHQQCCTKESQTNQAAIVYEKTICNAVRKAGKLINELCCAKAGQSNQSAWLYENKPYLCDPSTMRVGCKQQRRARYHTRWTSRCCYRSIERQPGKTQKSDPRRPRWASTSKRKTRTAAADTSAAYTRPFHFLGSWVAALVLRFSRKTCHSYWYSCHPWWRRGVKG